MPMDNTEGAEPRRKLLDPSELGTKQYWDQIYAREINNYDDDEDDEGTVWFSENRAEEVVLAQLDLLEQHGQLSRSQARFLDLGTGNGHMLFTLCETGDDEGNDDDDIKRPWTGDMVGVDYSVPSIDLARRIAAQRLKENSEILETISFEPWDVLGDEPGDWLRGGFDVVLDKGTFDAISLMAPPEDHGAHPCDVYRGRVIPLLKPEAFLLITSCNWTKDELVDWLSPDGQNDLEYYGNAKYPTFTFGGKTGQSIVTVVFRRARAP